MKVTIKFSVAIIWSSLAVFAQAMSPPVKTFQIEQHNLWQQLSGPHEQAMVLIELDQVQHTLALLKSWEPTNTDDWLQLNMAIANVFDHVEQHKKAMQFLEDVRAQAAPNNAAFWRQLLSVQLRANALAAFKATVRSPEVIEALPEPELAAWHLAAGLYKQSADNAASHDALSALATLPPLSSAAQVLATQLLEHKLLDELAQYALSTDKRQRNAFLVALTARASAAKGQTKRALQHFEQAAKLYGQAGQPALQLVQIAKAHRLRGEQITFTLPKQESPTLNRRTNESGGDDRNQANESIAYTPDAPRFSMKDENAAAPYFKSIRPRAFKQFSFPDGSAVRGGSGLVVSGGTRVITNRHVVAGGKLFAIRTGLGEISKARVVFESDTDDLAILELDTPLPRERAIEIADMRMAQSGSQVVAMGYPLWYLLGSETPSLTNGVVAKSAGMNEDPAMFQLTAKINRGNSGGPVFNMRGELVGLTMGKLDTDSMRVSEGFTPEDINFAIQADRIRAALAPNSNDVLPLTQGGAVLAPEQIYQDMLGKVVMVAVVVQ